MRSSFARDERGAALVEAALVLPIMLLLLFGVVDLSLYAWQSVSAGKAVQLAARRAVVSSPVAVGPGLTPAESEGYWNGLEPGAGCRAAGGGLGAGSCPVFAVTCRAGQGCACRGACRFTIAPLAFEPILAAARAALPRLAPENLEVTYATNGLGFVGRPVPVPVDVTVRLVGLGYDALFLPDLLGRALPIRAVSTLPGEDLRTD